MPSIQESLECNDGMGMIQIDLNHCEAAQDLLSQAIYERGVKVAIINERNRDHKNGGWTTDGTYKAAIWACGNEAIQEVVEVEIESGQK